MVKFVNMGSSGYRNAIIDALSTTVEVLTSHSEQSFDEVVAGGIQPVADAAGLDRICVYRLLNKTTGIIGQIYVWAYGKTVSLDKELVQLPNVPPVRRWLSVLTKGECVHGNVKFMDKDQADFCALFGVKSIYFVPVFTHGEFWGIVTLEDHTNYRYFDEDCLDLLRSAARLCANAFIRYEKTENANRAIEALEKREKLTKTLNNAAIKFISHEDDSFEKTMTSGVKLIVDILDVDRMSVWRNKQGKDELHLSQIYRWERKSGGTTIPVPGFDDVPYSSLVPRWEKYLAEDKTINGPVSHFPEAELLKSFNMVSLFVTPVFINNFFWGFVIFEDHEKERVFDNESVEMMRSASFLCVNTVLRAEMENEITNALNNIKEQSAMLKVRLEQQELISDISRGFISSGDTETFIKEAIAKLGLYHKVSKVSIFSVDYDFGKVKSVYDWTVDGSSARLSSANLFDLIKTTFPERLPECSTLPLLFCDDIAESSNKYFHPLLEIDINAFIVTPLYVEGRLWGIMAVEQYYKPRKWTDNEKSFVSMTAGTIAGVIMRGIYNTMLKEAYEKATIASKAKGEFLSNMSHEMRTPLNAIIGMTAIAKNAVDLARKNYALDKIEDASHHLLGVINDVLDMSKIEANKLELAAIEFNLERLLQKAVSVINFRAEEKKQKLSVYIDRAIPEFIVSDDQRIMQVVTNLLSNAVKFTPNGGSISLNAHLLREDDGICTIQISVSDTGIGISQEHQDRLFQSFEQAEASTVRKFGGTGLGLAICKNIVEMMDGEIWVNSELNNGSTFTFTIKVKIGQGKEINLTERAANWENIRILAVDDDKDVLEFFKDISSRYNVQCDTASSGEDALRLVERYGSYNVYFIDWKMPDIDGITLTGALKSMENKEGETSIVIMISAGEWTEIEDEARNAGVERFLSKPLFPSAIADTISECLGISRHEKNNEQKNIDETIKGKRILLAEDIDINREIVVSLFEPLGIEFDCAENGIVAAEMYCTEPERYHMILMDVQMPEMDGYDSTRAIRNFEKRHSRKPVPIIAMTANVFKEDIQKCLDVGMDDHVGKPLDFEVVLEKIKAWI